MPTPDPATLALLLGRLARLSETMAAEVCAAHGLTPAEFRVLSLLVHRPGGRASPSDIAAFVVQTSGGLTATLRRLEHGGLVERVADPDDGRGRLVVLTDPGRGRHDIVLSALADRIGAVLDGVDTDPGETEVLVRSLLAGFEHDAGMPYSAGFRAGLAVPVP